MPSSSPRPGESVPGPHGEQDAFYAPSFFLLGKAFEMRARRAPPRRLSKFLEILEGGRPG